MGLKVNIELGPDQYKLVGNMKVYFIHDNSGCGFQRAWMPCIFMREAKLAQCRSFYEDNEKLNNDITMRPQFRQSIHFREAEKKVIYRNIEWADVVVFQRIGTIAAIEAVDYAKSLGKPVVHDCDDYCEELPKGNPAHWYWVQAERLKIHGDAFRKADVITTTNPRIAKFYHQKYGKPTFVIPNMIDWESDRWRKPPVKEKKGIVIGWMGSESHQVDLGVLETVIPRILKKYPEARFEFLGWSPKWAEGMERVSNESVPLMLVPQFMAHWDIGLAPLIDHPFNTLGKSDIKFLEYSALNIATVAARLHPYKRTIQHKATGLLAKYDDSEDWFKCIDMLIRRPNVREQISSAAHYWVQTNRTMQRNMATWFRLYANLLIQRQKESTSPTEK